MAYIKISKEKGLEYDFDEGEGSVAFVLAFMIVGFLGGALLTILSHWK